MVVAWVYKDFEELAKCITLVKQDPCTENETLMLIW